MQIDWFTFFAQIINFLILVYLLKRFLYRPVINAMDEREQRIADRLEEARRKKEEAVVKEKEFQEKLDRFDDEKKKMMDEAKLEVEQRRKELMLKAREEIEQSQQRWNEVLENQKKVFARELEKRTGEIILKLIRLILTDLSNEELEEQTTRTFIERLKNIDQEHKNKLAQIVLDRDDNEIEIISSYKVSDQNKQKIEQILKEHLSENIHCSYEISPGLGFGIEFRSGGWCMGWNLDRYLNTIHEEAIDFFEKRSHGPPTEISKNLER